MKKYILGGIFLILAIFVGWYLQGQEPIENGRSLSPSEFLAYSQDETFTLIDVRNERELEETGVIAGLDDHKNVYNLDHVADLENMDKEGKYLFYCAHGNRTRYLKEYLTSLGFKHVYDLAGGEEAWTQAEYPLLPRN